MSDMAVGRCCPLARSRGSVFGDFPKTYALAICKYVGYHPVTVALASGDGLGHRGEDVTANLLADWRMWLASALP
jgi:hypothetical protein